MLGRHLPIFSPISIFRQFWNSKKPPHLWHGPWILQGVVSAYVRCHLTGVDPSGEEGRGKEKELPEGKTILRTQHLTAAVVFENI